MLNKSGILDNLGFFEIQTEQTKVWYFYFDQNSLDNVDVQKVPIL
jgi:hypothetical protein